MSNKLNEKDNSHKLNNYFVIDSGPDKGKKVAVYDGSIEKYNGYYYLLGTGSAGKVYRSKDLIHWDPSYEMVSADPSKLPPYADAVYPNYGAGDLLFHNGVMFYTFNGNNLIYGDPSTMNTKPVFEPLDKKLDEGIDSQMFVAANGDLLFIRKVNPNEPDPNTGAKKPLDAGAWYWNVQSFFDGSGDPGRSKAYKMLDTQIGQWANIDKFNFEGPEMYYYDGQYYLLYVGNNMAPRTGLYETGVAQADNYTDFNNSKKYPGKLLARNLEQMLLNYKVILPTAEHGWQPYQYTFTQPSTGWENINYDASDWSTGKGGFGYPLKERNVLIPSIYNADKTDVSDIWGAPGGPDKLWVRRTFTLDSVPKIAALRVRMEGYGKLYINGKEVHDQEGTQRSYEMIKMPDGVLHTGKNVISAEISTNGPQLPFYHIDFGLYDTKGAAVESDIVGPSQPNIIKGPNGFETWITYKALWDGDNGQGKDRVYFWGNEMVVDGPTSLNSPNLHFDAWAPTFQDRFDSVSSISNYKEEKGVTIQDKALSFAAANGLKEAIIKHDPINNFYLETNIKFNPNKTDHDRLAGITVWKKDDNNVVRFFIDRDNHTYIVKVTLNGKTSTSVGQLPSTFEFHNNDPRVKNYPEQYHTLTVYKNGSELFVGLDHYKLNDDKPVLVLNDMASPGHVGLDCMDATCSMDNITLTTGWNEYNHYINGWAPSWHVTDNGIQSPDKGAALTIKGDPVIGHEFTANIETGNLPNAGKAGMILEYVNAKNYVVAYTNYKTKQFEIHKIVNGKDITMDTASTARDTIYGNANFDEGLDQRDYVYKLRAPAEISQAKVLWFSGKYQLNNWIDKDFKLPNTNSPSFGFENYNESTKTWEKTNINYQDKGRGDFSIATFDSPLKTDQIKLNVPSVINKPFSFAVREDISAQNFYKTVRANGQVYLWVNNKLIFNEADPFPNRPAKVGFYTDNLKATYNSITSFEINKQAQK